MKVQLVDSNVINAYVLPFDGETVYMTNKADKVWSKVEKEAVIVHEATHARQHHAEMRLVLKGVFAVYSLERLVRGKGITGRFLYPRLVQAVVDNGFSYMIERIADDSAKREGLNEELASALTYLPEDTPQQKVVTLLVGNLHPSTKSRIRRLTKERNSDTILTRVMEAFWDFYHGVPKQ